MGCVEVEVEVGLFGSVVCGVELRNGNCSWWWCCSCEGRGRCSGDGSFNE